MNRQPNPELIDDDNPEWTEADFANAKPAAELLPDILGKEVADEVLARSRGQRGSQKAPIKQPVSIRLSSDVVEYFKAGGKGWQTRIDQALQEYMLSHSH
ncbi:MAG: BrnA antitoxin family protein [Gammaproteobacteria bacterium]|jgi:uncharacterized protein (DUF4415 family)|nr:BrnA antitoxin family protein [Gammaproteobacteria bacterium]MBT3489805.1 BrnA antitoxin family protein [Gammaproteobacteria bacterium]MBT3719065.1 BrnA antitoxin family protein [Gammaproteobacteria bacterium]MBT3843626.1 BrnA antitoxin family protein [Gammaproteobacteria bacterium]MBT3893005.1 BrnA antitoxin family protein [Gammaproteobacteria bacterium]